MSTSLVDLTGKVAIVTGGGANGGIGHAIAVGLAKLGADVAVPDLNLEGAQATAKEIEALGRRALADRCDVTKSANVEAFFADVVRVLGRISILVNNAGTTRDTLLMMMKEEDWDLVLNVNLKSVFNCCKAASRPMIKARYGRIINISSVVGLAGQAGQVNYAASKAGIIGLTKSLAKELGSRGITVNAVAPGYIPTALTNVLPESAREAAIKATPLGRLGAVEDVAQAVAFLASDAASFITGQVLSVDGGLVMQ